MVDKKDYVIEELTEEELEVETAPDPEEASIIPVDDIFALIEAKVADKIGELETEKEEVITLDDLKIAIAEQEPIVPEVTGVDEAEVQAKLDTIETKLKEEARGEFAKVQASVGNLAETGFAKIAEVETQTDVKLGEALNAGLAKIAKAEQEMAGKAASEIEKAKEDGKAFLAYQFGVFKKEILAEIDQKIADALEDEN